LRVTAYSGPKGMAGIGDQGLEVVRPHKSPPHNMGRFVGERKRGNGRKREKTAVD